MDHQEAIDQWCEKGILGILLLQLFFAPIAFGGMFPGGLPFLLILSIAMTLIWVVRIWLHPEYRWLKTPPAWPLLAFAGYALFRFAFTPVRYPAWEEMMMMSLYMLTFFITTQNLYRQEWAPKITYSCIALGAFLAFYGAFQFITHSNYVWHHPKPANYLGRASGSFINPNHFAAYLATLWPLALAYTLYGRPKIVSRILLGFSTLTLLAGIGFSGSRGGIIASGFGMILFLIHSLRFKRQRLAMALALVVMLGAGTYFASKSISLKKRFVEATQGGSVNDIRTRIHIWGAAVEMWKDHPWVGVGPGQFDVHYPEYRPTSVQGRPIRTHNDYLNVLVDWGLVGTLLLGILWITFIWIFLRTHDHLAEKNSDDTIRASNRYALQVGGLVSLCILLTHSIVEFNGYIYAIGLQAIVLISILTAQSRFLSDRDWVNPRLGGKIVLTLLLLSSTTFIGIYLKSRIPETLALHLANQPHPDWESEKNALLVAHQADPLNEETVHRIGELFRKASWKGEKGYRDLALQAIPWFEQAAKLNPHNPHNPMRIGMCLHWIDRHEETQPYFDQALALDPNNYYILAHMGWHYLQLENYSQARYYFNQSLKIRWWSNFIAERYLRILDQIAPEPPAIQASPSSP